MARLARLSSNPPTAEHRDRMQHHSSVLTYSEGIGISGIMSVLIPCLYCQTLTRFNVCAVCTKSRESARNRLPSRRKYRNPIYKAQPKTGICWICGKDGADTRDHLYADGPITKPAHRSCNSRRGKPHA